MFVYNYKIGITESPRVLSKAILSEIIFKLYDGLDIVFLFSPDGKISVRRRLDSEIRCDLIAQKLNGGGHSYAAAGIIKSTITQEDTESGKIRIQDVLKALQIALA